MALTSIIKPVQLVLLWAAASAALQPAAPLAARAAACSRLPAAIVAAVAHKKSAGARRPGLKQK